MSDGEFGLAGPTPSCRIIEDDGTVLDLSAMKRDDVVAILNRRGLSLLHDAYLVLDDTNRIVAALGGCPHPAYVVPDPADDGVIFRLLEDGDSENGLAH